MITKVQLTKFQNPENNICKSEKHFSTQAITNTKTSFSGQSLLNIKSNQICPQMFGKINYSHKLSFGSLRQERFDEIFPAFLANTDEKDQMTKAMSDVFLDMKEQNIWGKNIKVVDVGCGEGMTSSKIFKMTSKIFPDMNYDIDAIDNNSKQLADYANRFADSENFTVKTEQSDAFSKGISQKNADLILLSHSLYHAHPSQLKEIIPNVYNSMNDKGIAVISLLKDDSDFSKIQEEFGKYVTSNQETNPVSVKLEDIVGTINDDPNLAEHSQRQPYDAYVYFPKVPGGFEEFKQWQLNEPQKEAPNSECKLTLDLLEFIVHGEMGKLRKSEQLKPFLDTIENMFEKNGPDDEGHNRINFNGENIFLLGADNPLNKK